MGKKTRRARGRVAYQNIHTSNIRSLYRDGPWDPLDGGEENRERKYCRKIKPQSENQKRLMESIETCNVVVAVGPAGTGKT